MDLSRIDNIEFAGINYMDAPDYCDAYITSADYDGKEMNDKQLDEMNDNNDFVQEQLFDYLN